MKQIKISFKHTITTNWIEPRTVYCKTMFSLKGPSDYLDDFINFVSANRPFFFTVYTQAYAKPEDKFSLKKGIQIVKAKSESKIYKSVQEMVNRYIKYLEHRINLSNAFSYKATKVISNNTKFLTQF